jgi:hypothetical protein
MSVSEHFGKFLSRPAAIFTAAAANRQKAFPARSEGVNPVAPFREMRDPDLLGISARIPRDKLLDHLNTDCTCKKVWMGHSPTSQYQMKPNNRRALWRRQSAFFSPSCQSPCPPPVLK